MSVLIGQGFQGGDIWYILYVVMNSSGDEFILEGGVVLLVIMEAIVYPLLKKLLLGTEVLDNF